MGKEDGTLFFLLLIKERASHARGERGGTGWWKCLLVKGNELIVFGDRISVLGYHGDNKSFLDSLDRREIVPDSSNSRLSHTSKYIDLM